MGDAYEAMEMMGRGGRPLPDHDNHHNAAMCPYCMDNGTFVVVRAADLSWLTDQVDAGYVVDPDAPTFKRLLDAKYGRR